MAFSFFFGTRARPRGQSDGPAREQDGAKWTRTGAEGGEGERGRGCFNPPEGHTPQRANSQRPPQAISPPRESDTREQRLTSLTPWSIASAIDMSVAGVTVGNVRLGRRHYSPLRGTAQCYLTCAGDGGTWAPEKWRFFGGPKVEKYICK